MNIIVRRGYEGLVITCISESWCEQVDKELKSSLEHALLCRFAKIRKSVTKELQLITTVLYCIHHELVTSGPNTVALHWWVLPAIQGKGRSKEVYREPNSKKHH